ncbi:protein ninH [Escherichia coli]|uniref:protein ninH n=1 Tax=Escherichia coli TaxID=562 RepID=UPI0011C82193|nr:protein ninH [Escherichia coli]TXR03886.1 protein ninH [Escherichia coli]
MNATIQTIPELLIQARGNLTEVSRNLNCNRATVRKYVGDKEGKRHAVVNGVLMGHRGCDKGKASEA